MRLVLAAAIAALPAMAHADAAEDALEARHGYMKMLSINMGTLSGMAKGEIDYDEAAASQAGTNIEAISQYYLPGLFIEGTSNEDMDDSEALPAIWENSADFASKYTDLTQAAAGAGEAVAAGQDSIGPVLQKLGGACKACHDDFRED